MLYSVTCITYCFSILELHLWLCKWYYSRVIALFVGVTVLESKSLRWTGVTRKRQMSSTQLAAGLGMDTPTNNSSMDRLGLEKCEYIFIAHSWHWFRYWNRLLRILRLFQLCWKIYRVVTVTTQCIDRSGNNVLLWRMNCLLLSYAVNQLLSHGHSSLMTTSRGLSMSVWHLFKCARSSTTFLTIRHATCANRQTLLTSLSRDASTRCKTPSTRWSSTYRRLVRKLTFCVFDDSVVNNRHK